jgi:pilus assembly protein TadC
MKRRGKEDRREPRIALADVASTRMLGAMVDDVTTTVAMEAMDYPPL